MNIRAAFWLGLPNRDGSLPTHTQRLYDAGQIAGVMVSAGALWEKGRFHELGCTYDDLPVFLDSAGFVAAKRHGGYPWTPEQYVEHVACMAHRPVRWSAMDLCCEKEVAPYRAEVRARIDQTAVYLARCRRLAALHREQGLELDAALGTVGAAPWPPDPMPVLQGWEPDDYLLSVELTDVVLTARRLAGAWPDLVGVGSVCRRRLNGPDGIHAILDQLDRALPAHVGLHLFGVHSEAIAEIADHPRVASYDSQAWGQDSRRLALNARAVIEATTGEVLHPAHPLWVGDTLSGKVAAIERFVADQKPSPQITLFGART